MESDARFGMRHAAACAGLAIAGAVVLRSMGRTLWCAGGEAFLWSGDIWSRHNSQHLVDPYTATHVLHGVALYGILWLLLGSRTGVATRAVVAIAVQVCWEILENTDMVIERYRATTISLNYYGDSVANSLGDITACGLGFLIAALVPTWVSVAGFFAVDAILLLWIRDSLLLNVLMLVSPLQAVRDWQMNGRSRNP